MATALRRPVSFAVLVVNSLPAGVRGPAGCRASENNDDDVTVELGLDEINSQEDDHDDDSDDGW